jgi:hypothetical protein
MLGIVGSLGNTLEMDMLTDFIQKTLYRLLDVHVPTKLVKTVVGFRAPLNLEATSSNALHLLRTSLCAKFVGPALATQVDRSILAEISELPVVLIPGIALHLNVCKDLIASLEQQFCDPEYEKDTQYKRPLNKQSRKVVAILIITWNQASPKSFGCCRTEWPQAEWVKEPQVQQSSWLACPRAPLSPCSISKTCKVYRARTNIF